MSQQLLALPVLPELELTAEERRRPWVPPATPQMTLGERLYRTLHWNGISPIGAVVDAMLHEYHHDELTRALEDESTYSFEGTTYVKCDFETQ